MADLRYQSSAPARGQAAEIDQGLRSYMLGVYNYMALGVAATAIITLFVASTPALLATAVSLRWVFFIGILGMGFLAPRMIFSSSSIAAPEARRSQVKLAGSIVASASAIRQRIELPANASIASAVRANARLDRRRRIASIGKRGTVATVAATVP